jgi:glucosamine--fructose-6-phosphate aminotransferase (isomerizing)
VGEYLFEDLARIPVEVEYASEFRYRNPIVNEDDIVIAISQSGETADTWRRSNWPRAAVQPSSASATWWAAASRAGHPCGSYTHAGPEIGVASTKAFTGTGHGAHAHGADDRLRRRAPSSGALLPTAERVGRHPGQGPEGAEDRGTDQVHRRHLQGCTQCTLPGPRVHFPWRWKGALKLKEISYIHAEGYPAAEMKHGPIALIDEAMPVFVIATKGASYEKVVSNIQEVKARKGKIIAIVTEGDTW